MKDKKRDTRLGHAGRHPEDNFGIVNPPVYHASTIIFPTVKDLNDGAKDRLNQTYYGRYGTPTTFALEEAIAELEGSDRAIITCSGMAAIAGAILPFVKTGDHILIPDSAYFPTRKFCDGFLRNFGVETTYYDPMVGAGIADLMRPETKLILVESPGSITFEVQDIPAIVEAAHKGGAKVICDNTWSGGIFFQPFDHGVDISLQAATKYIVGHSDAMLGVIAVPEDLYSPMKMTISGMGYCAAPDDCYLALRGLRTLPTRLARHQETGLTLAHWLAARPEVDRVLHPALPECPGHEIWKRDFTGASGLFSVVLKPYSDTAVAAMLDNLELYAMGFSWGGFESLILPSDPTTTRTATTWEKQGPLLRIHAGLEDADDLIADLEAGFKRLAAANV